MADARRWCEAHGDRLDDQLDLSDAGRSSFRGDPIRRGALGRFLTLAQAHQLGQEPTDALEGVVFALVRAGVAVVDLEAGDTYDRESLRSNQLVMLVLRAQAAHDYSRRLSRRIGASWNQALERARAGEVMRGRDGRGGRHPHWIALDDRGQWKLNNHSRTIQLIFKLADRGITTTRGKRWSASRITALLHDRAARGDLVLEKKAREKAIAARRERKKAWPVTPLPELEVIEDYYPAAVHRSNFERIQRVVQRRAEDNSVKGRKANAVMRSWLQGLIHCQHGNSMTASLNSSRKQILVYLRCRARQFGGGCRCTGKG